MQKLKTGFLIAILGMLSAVAHADDISLSTSTPFGKDSGASDKVKNECGLDTRLPRYIEKYAKSIELVSGSMDEVEGKVLHLEFANVYAPGGGGYSGAKSIVVDGKLTENGELIGSFQVRRATIIGMMPGTCSMLKRVVKKLGKDIAPWIKSPTMDAKLGDLEDDEKDNES